MTEPTTVSEPYIWGEIDGQVITFPMEVADLDAATILFTVPLPAAQALVPGDAFEVIDMGNGTAQMIIALCDYHENPWGAYLEINLGFLARPVGASADVIGSFVYRMPVDQAFTCRAGNQVMGFPKTIEKLERTDADGRVTFAMASGGVPVISVSFPLVDGSGATDRIDSVSYSYLAGVPHATPLSMALGAAAVDPGDVEVVLGRGPVADELRSLGLPKRPDMAMWGTGLSGTFQLGESL
ncbi:MAG: acetoacetate decarboxylase family protein [Aquihabitans sp.]